MILLSSKDAECRTGGLNILGSFCGKLKKIIIL
jgi:hypothetical protein